MNYISTRGKIEPVKFKEAVMMGLATDGGLLLPDVIPSVSIKTLDEWRKMNYQELAYEIFRIYADDIPFKDLKELINRSYLTFNHPEITPVILKNGVYILELFHGPTLAFKDVALQFLGNLFEYLLKEKREKMNILGATSGDTGSAAIYGVRGKENIKIFIIHPHKKVSQIQELQMTTVTDANVFNIAVKGNFDNGQRIVKKIFNDIPFKEKYRLGAVNSINWARILAQVVYYFYAYFKVAKIPEKVSFSVPTGNFGDIFAGYIAKKMGLPVDKLILATNENNILSRFVKNGDYSISDVVETLSPSMDIQIASNFERYLYYLYGEDSNKVEESMFSFSENGRLGFSENEKRIIQKEFETVSVNRSLTLDTIRKFYNETGYTLDPHTSVGVKAALKLKKENIPVIALATAHPAKFGDAVKEATGKEVELPDFLKDIRNRHSRCEIVPASTKAVKKYIEDNAFL